MENSPRVTLDHHQSLDINEQKEQETDTFSYIPQTYTQTNMAQVNMKNVVCKTNEEEKENIVDDYWNISNSEFKQRFLLIVKDDDLRKIQIQQWLETERTGLLQFVRQRSSLVANVYSLKMEHDFWQNYSIHKQVEALWLSKMAKSMIHLNHISDIFFKTPYDMKKKLKIIEKQLKQAVEKLTEHILEEEEEEEEVFLKLSKAQHMKSFLLAIIIRFIRQNQQQLRTKYNEKHSQLMLIVNDIRLVQAFYDLKPNLLQISLARTIWRTIILHEQAKKNINHFEQEMSDNSDIDFYAKLQTSMTDPMYKKLTVNQFKEHFLLEKISLTKAEVEGYTRNIQHHQEIFLCSSQHEQNSTVNAQILLDTIENRRQTLRLCFQSIPDFSKTLSHHINNDADNDNHYDDQSDTTFDDTDSLF